MSTYWLLHRLIGEAHCNAIAGAVQKGNKDLLDWLNNEIVELGKEKFFHADYEATLRSVYGKDSDADSLVVEGGKL